MPYLRSLTCRYDGGMHPAFAILLTVMGLVTFVLWCAIRAGTRPTPTPEGSDKRGDL